MLRLQDNELSARRGLFLDIIGGSQPELDKSHLVPDRSRYCLLVSDREGFVIEAYAPESHEADFERAGIAPGGLWDERMAGTNGIDLALRTRKVITVQGDDHFHACFHGFACSAAPLHDGQDNLIGALTLVGAAQRRADEIAWCEQILRVAGQRLQERLFRRLHGDRITARLVSSGGENRRKFETMVACDESGFVTSTLSLSRDDAAPPEQRDLAGRHLSELRDLTISVQGPVLTPPRRPIRQVGEAPRNLPLTRRPSEALSKMAAQGAGVAQLVDRARKLLSHRVPLVICGEAGVEKTEFAQAVREDLGLNAQFAEVVDGAAQDHTRRLGEALAHVRFLSEHPIENCTPVLTLLNADRLDDASQHALEAFLAGMSDWESPHRATVSPPVLMFSVTRSWADLQNAPDVNQNLLYLMGQGVVELPPLRARDLDVVLNGLLEAQALTISDPAREALLAYSWPGNMREMRAVVREAQICGNGERITRSDLPPRVLSNPADAVAPNRSADLLEALDSAGWNVTKAARLLGKSRATVNRWIAAEGLSRPQKKGG